MHPYRLRKANLNDVAELMALFRDTVLFVNARDYTCEEVNDWASCGIHVERWQEMIQSYYFIVATDQQAQITGFASISPSGYLHSTFVHKAFQGKGVATLLLNEIERYAKENEMIEITSEVSITARPFFEKRGYKVVKEQRRQANKLALTNYEMSLFVRQERE